MPEPRKPSDSWIDRQLRDVAVPSGMLARLEAIAAEASGSADLATQDDSVARFEAWLQDVPLPAGAMERWQAIAAEEANAIEIVAAPQHTTGMPHRYARLALAASLMIGIGLTYFGAMVTWVSARHVPAVAAAEPGFLVAQWDETPVDGLDVPDEALAFAWILPPRPVEATDAHSVSQWLGDDLAAARERWREEWQAGLSDRTSPEVEHHVRTPLGPLGPAPLAMGLNADERIATDPLVAGQSVSDRKWRSIFGGIPASREDDERFPEPDIVPWKTARGIAPPKVAGFDLPFLIRSGVHPVVSLDPRRVDPGLRYCQAPLRSETFSYDLFRRGLALDRPVLPDHDDVRVEEFLAAIDYGYDPPKKDALELHVAGGASLFQESGSLRIGKQTQQLPRLPGMVHIGVRARNELEGWRQGCRLTVVIDRSRSMRQGGRMEMVRRGLAELIDQLSPADRLNLVTFDTEPAVLLEDGVARNADERQTLADAVLKLAAGGSTNLVAGLQSAYGIAGSHARNDGLQHRLVLLTDGAELSDHALDLLESRLAATRREGLALFAVDLSEGVWADPQLLRLAEAGGGRLLRAKSVDEVRWALCEVLTGRSQIVANQVELRVEFNPEAVEMYRLIGHEASDLDRLNGAPLETTLRVGQTATALFEILPKARFHPDQPLARIELRWLEPYGGEQRVTKTITGAEFPPRFEDASVALQRAAIAAEAAEVLRESPFVERGMTLTRVIDQSGRVRRESAGEESFLRFLQTVGQAAELQGKGRGR